MAASTLTAEHSTPEVFTWLKTLPLAPEYHPTIQEFQDPIAYIFKIEKEASQFGICKIVPPFPPQSRKSVISNFNRSLSAQNPNSSSSAPAFSTRMQQIGFCPRKNRPIQKSVWQSGEAYTLQQFEAKAKIFEKNYLKNRTKKTVSPLEVETLYWKANGDKTFSVEYANDMPGSAFGPMKTGGEIGLARGSSVGDTAWNMRGVARANGSLLRFMKEEIPGVTSPMLYVAMMFSWFAWHVEDHDLHSLNYLHLGAGKTWYGVPKDAAHAFEEVIRVHGFGEEVNPLVTFATLEEKTSVMSPEVLVKAGVPCCRLVQNAGEFVITFPRAYHSGFSHGFNCGEASNIATPEWLKFAKDAAIRRASINYPPMVSHFQLLYDLALSLCSRGAMGSSSEPRSSRLKDKKKGEGETLVKQMFVEDVVQNNELLSTLGQGSEVVLLPHNSSEKFVWSNLRVGSKYKVKPGLPFSLYSSQEAIKASDDIMLARDIKKQKSSYSIKGKFTSTRQKNKIQSQSRNDSMFTLPLSSKTQNQGGEGRDELSNRGLFSCVKCGIWTFACVAVVQPTESSSRYLMSADCSLFNGLAAGSLLLDHEIDATNGEENLIEPSFFPGSMEKNAHDGLYDIHVQSSDSQIQSMKSTDETNRGNSNSENKNDSSALGLLAMAYGDFSDSDSDDRLLDRPALSDDNISADTSWGARFHTDNSPSPTYEQCYDSGVERDRSRSSSQSEFGDEGSPSQCDLYGHRVHQRANSDVSECEAHDCSIKFTEEDTMTSELIYSPSADENDTAKIGDAIDILTKPNFPFAHKCDEDSSRMHVFCLEHAVEVEKQLRPIGGVRIILLCHPDYPKVEAEAKKAAEELGMNYAWNDITFSEATKDDEERIQLALQSEEATPKNGDWAVKLGINLFYSAILSRSPLYNKQMPYNSVIYSVFGCTSPSKSSPEAKALGKHFGRQKKLVVAGKWCGKVWMSNQVHPLLVQRDFHEDESTVDNYLNPKQKISKKAQTAPLNRKVTKKRSSTTAETRKPTKKLKFEPGEYANIDDPDDSEGDKPAQPEPRRCVRKTSTKSRPVKRIKPWEEEIPQSGSEDSMDDKLLSGTWRSARSLGKKSTHKVNVQQKPMVGCSDDSLDDVHKFNSRRAKPVRVRKPTRKVLAQEKEEVMMGSESEGLPDDDDIDDDDNNNDEQFDPVSEEDEGGPSTRLRKKTREKPKAPTKRKNDPITKNCPARKGPRMRLPKPRAPSTNTVEEEEVEEGDFVCDIEGCSMGFGSKQELTVHKRNICPVKGCGKKFFSHKYLVQHRRVHMDDRPLRCPWKGCRMTFKWAWARTEHIRVHTGARPYVCNEPGCGQTFRFVSDFSRHKRKTGHSAKKKKTKK